ncbi:hypothetical protein [Vibrio sp. 10N.247.310.17]|uniref:hypothetical protein n=1 Tax=Vibrio sp. 10N.247.310.17 TaxID=3229979 RepID=UPI00354E822F
MRNVLLIILLSTFFVQVSAATLNINSNMSVWWKSSKEVRAETTLSLVKNMDRKGILNPQSESNAKISANLMSCAEASTEGLDSINNSQSIGTVLLLCVYQMNYMR